MRPYVVGDDVRKIDWNVTARTGEPHVRAHVAERRGERLAPARHVGIDDLRDRRPPQVGRRRGRRPRRRSPRRTAWQPARGRDVRRPRSRSSSRDRYGRRGLLGLLHALRREPSDEALGADLVRRRLRPGGAARPPPLARRRRLGLPRAARLAQVACCASPPGTTSSPSRSATAREQELPNVGTVWLVDPETREQLQVDTRDARMRARFAESAAAERLDSRRMFRSAGVPHVVVSTSGDWLRTLVRFLQIEKVRRDDLRDSHRARRARARPRSAPARTCSSSDGASSTPSASRTCRYSRTSSTAPRAGDATYRRSSCSRLSRR